MSRKPKSTASSPYRLAEWRRHVGLTLEKVGDHLGMSGQNYGKIERGSVHLQPNYLRPLAELYGVEASALLRSPRSNPENEGSPAQLPDLPTETDVHDDLDGVVMLNEYDARLSAGPGLVPAQDAVVRTWPYPRFLIIDRLGMNPETSAVQEIMGDSMFPTLASGDFVVIDLGQRRVRDEGIFVVRHGDTLLVKRIQHQIGSSPAALKIKSDNPAYDEFVVLAEELEILGQIRWISKRA